MSHIKKMELFDPISTHSFTTIFKSEWIFWIVGATFSFFLASLYMTGWPSGLLPNFNYPFIYAGDGLSHSWMINRVQEGWIFDNPRSGYPFGSNFLDYPGSDSGNLLILKLIGIVTGKYYLTYNLYFLLGFFATFIASYCVLRAIGLVKPFAFSCAVLFNFLPFHFLRLGHIFYTWYFVIPLYFHFGFYLFYFRYKGDPKISKATYLFFAVSLIVLASFGVYFAVFGAIIFLVSGIAGAVRNQHPSNAILAFFAILAVIFGVLINVGPNIINNYVNGRNQEVAIRSPAESEIYGFKMMQLILPANSHRLKELSEIKLEYTLTAPLNNENNNSTLGLFGAAGFLIIGSLLLIILAGAKVDSRLNLLTLLVIVLFLFGTIGGLGAFFSWFISPLIRSWNRISIFIGFGAIATFFLVAQLFVEKYFPSTMKKLTILFVALTVLSIGLYDQTNWGCESCNEQTKTAFEMDREFIQKIEHSLPQGSAIYQLPYMPFPEASRLNRLASYDLSAGFLHSKSLKWSYAGMRGRSGDFFYRSLSNEPIEEQLEIIRKLGFAGIYIDRRGYEDNAKAIIDEFSLLIGKPTFIRSDGEIVFFPVKTEVTPANLESLTPEQIMENVDYFVDILGKRYKATLKEGIDFTRGDFPDFVKSIKGLSGSEPWGRWSDDNLAPSVIIELQNQLPNRFNLVFSALPFGRNAGQDLRVKIGSHAYNFKLRSKLFEYSQLIDLGGEKVTAIEFIPPNPTFSGRGNDYRKLGIGLVRLRFETNFKY